MKSYPITVHTIVKNEERFIWYALNSVLPLVQKVLLYDTGSTDHTVDIINIISDKKIQFAQKGPVFANELVNLRQEQITATTTDFFLLLDGDEVWPQRNLIKLLDRVMEMPKKKLAIFCRTRNAVGDIYHYLPEDAGEYHLAGIKGHLNIRLFRNVPNLDVAGTYPLEAYRIDGIPLNNHPKKLEFVDTWYLHLTHLLRSSSREKDREVVGREGKYKYELGKILKEEELPEVFWQKPPSIVPPLPEKRSRTFFLQSLWQTPLRRLKRKLVGKEQVK